jgi:hypothetical protein
LDRDHPSSIWKKLGMALKSGHRHLYKITASKRPENSDLNAPLLQLFRIPKRLAT